MLDHKKTPPTDKQFRYAEAIKAALKDSVDLYAMDKWEMRDYISRNLSNNERAIEIDRYFINQRRRREIKFGSRHRLSGKAYLSDDSLNANWGLDACDFGIFPWGDS